MPHLDHVMPWINLRQGKAPKRKLKPGHRNAKHRRFTQQHVREMREMSAAGFSIQDIAEFWDAHPLYVRNLCYHGLRDDEREGRGVEP